MLKEEIKNIPTQVTRKELRKFCFTIGVVFGLFAVFLMWKSKSSGIYFGYTSVIFLVVGMFIPTFFKHVYIIWMSLAVVMGYVMTRVLLTLIYAVIFTPVGLVIRVLGKDPLQQKWDKNATSYWIKRDRDSVDLKAAENQY